jgi:murein DD-endopeptidase MepM/ murein hydrolase activator NlpD
MPAESFMRYGIGWIGFTGMFGSVIATLIQLGFSALGQPVNIVLPTENHGLLTGDNAAFYQYIKRDFEGIISTPWEGGQYGFVRNPRRFGGTVLDTRFHEGMDIRPLQRDANGEPLDVIHAIAPGTVVYTNTVPSYSNYGRYIVIEHQFGGCPYFSLYAHLSAISIAIGERVAQGDPIAIMGHTGEGIDRERSHVHLELNLLVNGDFERWSNKYFKGDGNRHGNFNGQNLDGIDIARLYLELAKNPQKTISEFVQEETTWYRVLVPASPRMDLLQRYPWLSGGQTAATSWEISFNQAGIPLRLEAKTETVAQPTLTWMKFSPYPYALQTRGYIQGSGSNYRLSKDGERYLDLISPTE